MTEQQAQGLAFLEITRVVIVVSLSERSQEKNQSMAAWNCQYGMVGFLMEMHFSPWSWRWKSQNCMNHEHASGKHTVNAFWISPAIFFCQYMV